MIYGMKLTQSSGTRVLQEESQWGTCWGLLQRTYDHDRKDPLKKLVIKTYINHFSQKVMFEFINSGFFKTLCKDTFSIELSVEENKAFLTADGNLGASRFITAARYLKADSNARGLPEDLFKYVPFVQNAFRVSGEAYCDDGVTMYPTTANTIMLGLEMDDDWDDEDTGDIDLSDWYVERSFNDGANKEATSSISLEMLARVWNRTDDEMDALCFQNKPILSCGYFKDCESDRFVNLRNRSGDILTISAPVTDVMLDGETPIQGLTVLKICEYLQQHDKYN